MRLAAPLVLLCAANAVAAEDAPKTEPRTVLFGSLDVGSSGFLNLGLKRSLTGSLDQSGPIVMGILGGGGSPESTEHRATGALRFRPTVQANALFGYQWIVGPVTLAGLVGPELDYERGSDPVADRSRTRAGLRGHAELWAHPTPDTLLTATLIAGSARGHVWSRLSAGYAVWDRVFIGPEASFYRTDDYREVRLGAHVTGLTWSGWNWRLSGGFMRVEDDRAGAYVGVTGYLRM
jgi:Cellulose biosynthesis protein BcsS